MKKTSLHVIRNENAISEVIGVILTVALVVIMAAIVAAFTFGMVGNFSKNKDAGVSVQTNTTHGLVVTLVTGRDIATLDTVRILVNGIENVTYNGPFSVGQRLYGVDEPASYTNADITVVGYFSDKTIQILVKKEL